MINYMKITFLFLMFLLHSPYAFSADCSGPYNKLKDASTEENLRELNDKFPDCDDIAVKLGDYYFDHKMYLAAYNIFQKLRIKYPSDLEILEKLEKIQEVAPLIASKPEDIEVATKSIQKRGLGNAKKLPPIAIHFDTGSAVFSENEKKMLDKMVEIMKRDYLSYKFEVQGHTDSQGDEQYNQGLSEKRARAVAKYLFEHGIEPGRIEIKGFGKASPIASNLTDDGKLLNRRVQFEGHRK